MQQIANYHSSQPRTGIYKMMQCTMMYDRKIIRYRLHKFLQCQAYNLAKKSAQLRLFSFASVSRACFPLSFEQPILRELCVKEVFTIHKVCYLGDSSNLLLRLFGPSGIGSHTQILYVGANSHSFKPLVKPKSLHRIYSRPTLDDEDISANMPCSVFGLSPCMRCG